MVLMIILMIPMRLDHFPNDNIEHVPENFDDPDENFDDPNESLIIFPKGMTNF